MLKPESNDGPPTGLPGTGWLDLEKPVILPGALTSPRRPRSTPEEAAKRRDHNTHVINDARLLTLLTVVLFGVAGVLAMLLADLPGMLAR